MIEGGENKTGSVSDLGGIKYVSHGRRRNRVKILSRIFLSLSVSRMIF